MDIPAPDKVFAVAGIYTSVIPFRSRKQQQNFRFFFCNTAFDIYIYDDMNLQNRKHDLIQQLNDILVIYMVIGLILLYIS